MNAFLQQLGALSRRYPVAVVSIVIFVVLGTADWFLWKRWDELAGESERTRQEGQTMLLSLSGHPRIQAQSAAATEALTFINNNLAAESDLAGNLDYFLQIEKTTRARLANLSQLSSQPVTDKEAYIAIPFSLRLAGTYPQILAYLHALETGPRLVRVRNYRFSANTGGPDALSVDLTVDMLGRP